MEVERERIVRLVKQLQNGDKSVFDELYKITSSRAYFVALEITKNEQDAEDILQESYIKMLDKIGSLDKPESFVSWFHHMVANKSKDSLKKKKPTLFESGVDEAFEVIPDEDISFRPEESLNQEELHCVVMEAIEELTEEKRACVMMMYFEEMSVNEISESLEIPVSTVKNRVFTARKDLKAKFEKRGITSLYSTAPIGVVIWALTKTSEAVSQTFAQGGGAARVLSGITVSGATGAAAVSATTAGTVTATATTSTAGGAAAGTGAVVKIAATTAAQKVIAGIVAVGVVSGSAVGITTVVKNSNNTEETTSVIHTEEITTAPSTQALEAIAVTTAESTTSTTDAATILSTTAKETTTEKIEPTATTAKPETTKPPQSEQPTTQKRKTTTERTTLHLTTKEPTTTTAPPTTVTTTRKRRATTTQKPSTTRSSARETEATTLAPATLTVQIIDLDDTVVDTMNFEVEPDTVLSWDYVMELVQSKGTNPEGGFNGQTDPIDAVAQSGQTYTFHAYL